MEHDEIGKILREALGEAVQENVPMRQYTTMRVGGVADYFYQAKTIENLILALHTVFENHIPYLLIAGGSNVIFADAGFPGLVIHNVTTNISFIPETSQIIADSGTIYARLITEAASHGLGGLEYWFGLPGTVGGAAINNAETWGHSMAEVVRQLTLLFPPVGDRVDRIERVPVSWMEYSYRSSKLKSWSDADKPIILTVTLQTQQQHKEEIMRRMKEYKQGRWDLNQPKGLASAGSFFKNPGGPTHEEGKSLPPEASAGWLLEQVGAKQLTVGQAAVAKQHANFLVNLGNASAQDIYQLAKELKRRVKEQFDIDLEEEVQYLGAWPDEES